MKGKLFIYKMCTLYTVLHFIFNVMFVNNKQKFKSLSTNLAGKKCLNRYSEYFFCMHLNFLFNSLYPKIINNLMLLFVNIIKNHMYMIGLYIILIAWKFSLCCVITILFFNFKLDYKVYKYIQAIKELFCVDIC